MKKNYKIVRSSSVLIIAFFLILNGFSSAAADTLLSAQPGLADKAAAISRAAIARDLAAVLSIWRWKNIAGYFILSRMMIKMLRIAFILAIVLPFASVFAAADDLMISWRDLFDDNHEKWYIGETEGFKSEIAGGQYRITDKTGGRMFGHAVDFDRGEDFRLEVKMRGTSSDPSTWVAFIWDRADWDNYYYIAVSPEGKFAIFREERGSTVVLSPWKSGPAPKGDRAFRNISVRKKGLKLLFDLDGKEVASLPYMSCEGKSIGVSFIGAQTFELDSMALYQNLRPTGPIAGPSAEAKTVYSTQFGKDQTPWLLSNGKLKGRLENSPAAAPRTILEHSETGRIDWLTEEREFDPRADFSIEASAAWLSGEVGSGYGLVMDARENESLVFAVSAEGRFRIGRTSPEGWEDIAAWSKSPNILRYEAANRLGVYRRNNWLVFALGGREVHRMRYDDWTSRKVGFFASDKMAIQPLSLSIYAEPYAEGILAGSCVSGFGARRYKDGSLYMGNWEGSKPNGLGALYDSMGKAREGLWREGNFVSERPPLSQPLFPVRTRSGDLGLVDASGNPVAFGLKDVAPIGRPVSGPALFADRGKIGFVDSAGLRRGPPDYSLLSPFSEGWATAVRGKGRFLVGSSGEEVLPADASLSILETRPVELGVVLVTRKEGDQTLYGLMSVSGETLRVPDLAAIGPFKEGLAAAETRDGIWGFIDRLGRWRVLPDYDKVDAFSEGLAYCGKGDFGAWFVDANGDIVMSFDFDQTPIDPRRCSNGLIPFVDGNGELGFVDKVGDMAIDPGLGDDTLGFSEGLTAVRHGKTWMFVDTAGQSAFPGDFEEVDSFSRGLAAARKDNAWGYIDTAGAWAILPGFAEAGRFGPEGLAQVKTAAGSWTWIDRTGKPVWTEVAELPTLWREDFDDNSKGWAVGEGQAVKVSLDKGHYNIVCRSPSGYMGGVALPLDRGADYSVSAQFSYAGQTMNEAIAFLWDLKDGDNFYAFVIHPLGNFAIVRTSGENTTRLADWAQSPAIKKGAATNKLEVRKEGAALSFSINDEIVKVLPYETFGGGGIGFACYGAANLSADWVWARQAVKR